MAEGQGKRRRGLAALAGALLMAASPAAAHPPQCGPISHVGNDYTICVIDLTESELRLFWQDAAGNPYLSFNAIDADLLPRGEVLAVAMNAGMFDTDHDPIGLYIEHGQTLKSANTNEGPGNFHLMPNGIFYWSGSSAGVMETSRFLAERPAADHATQSGPMLLIGGEVHPRFLPDSDSFRLRNGVGILDGGRTVVFAITEEPVTFMAFALFFRDRLGVMDALYLDGSLSQLRGPGIDTGGFGRLGPILGVVDRR